MFYKIGIGIILTTILSIVLGVTFLHDYRIINTIAPGTISYPPDLRTKSTVALYESSLMKNKQLFPNVIYKKNKLYQSLKKDIYSANENCDGCWKELVQTINISDVDSALMLTIKSFWGLADPLYRVIPLDSEVSIALFHPQTPIGHKPIFMKDKLALKVYIRTTEKNSSQAKIEHIKQVQNFLNFIARPKTL